MIHINNIQLTSGQVLVELEEPFVTVQQLQKLPNLSKEQRDANRLNTSIRHGKVLTMSTDIKEFVFGDKNPQWSKMELERYQDLQWLREPDTVVLLPLNYGEVFDVPMFKGDKDTKVGHCLTLNPSNIKAILK